jgi:hypothetical protein
MWYYLTYMDEDNWVTNGDVPRLFAPLSLRVSPLAKHPEAAADPYLIKYNPRLSSLL